MDSENMSKFTESTVQKSDDYKEIFFNDHTVMFLIDPVTLKIMDANLAAINFLLWDTVWKNLLNSKYPILTLLLMNLY